MIGWRARIGILYPASGFLDADFHRLAPPGVSVHIQRVSNSGEATISHIEEFSRPDILTRLARDLDPLRLDCVAWACTSGSFLGGREGSCTQIATLERNIGIRFTSTSQAAVRALQHLRVRRVGVATPYPADFNGAITRFLEAYDFEVVAIENLGLKTEWEIASQPAERIYDIGRKAAVDSADAVFIACTGFPALDLINTLETDLNRPVITANQVTMWDALRLCGVSGEGLGQFGVLFAKPK